MRLFQALNLADAPSRDEAAHKTRELGVLFKGLHIVGLRASASCAPTLSSALNPLSVLDAIENMGRPPIEDILSGFEGVVGASGLPFEGAEPEYEPAPTSSVCIPPTWC